MKRRAGSVSRAPFLRKHPLPAKHPTVTEAASQVRQIMWLWITERLTKI